MKIEQSQVTKLMITGAKMPDGLGTLDPIAVIVENFEPGAGKITITCFGEAWSSYWGCMGETHTMESFFCKADKHYLAGKLKTGIKDRVRDTNPATVEQSLKSEIIKDRREGRHNHEDARDLWQLAELLSENIANNQVGDQESDLLYTVLGDEWWYSLPMVPNPEYEYLCNIIEAIKAAFQQLKESA